MRTTVIAKVNCGSHDYSYKVAAVGADILPRTGYERLVKHTLLVEKTTHTFTRRNSSTSTLSSLLINKLQQNCSNDEREKKNYRTENYGMCSMQMILLFSMLCHFSGALQNYLHLPRSHLFALIAILLHYGCCVLTSIDLSLSYSIYVLILLLLLMLAILSSFLLIHLIILYFSFTILLYTNIFTLTALGFGERFEFMCICVQNTTHSVLHRIQMKTASSSIISFDILLLSNFTT